ncbi:SRPBCC domain-containing protein [Yoonia sp. 2307UL14-13]|uniref:SRPBCC domain-containing protein n=1 Tax=Yoonia sp. 2307UL14-13 TaxID=3126506 RepID=UPI0030A0A04F
MASYHVARDIGASPEKVWAILTDPAKLNSDFGIVKMTGNIRLGSKIKLWSEVDPKRAFGLRVKTFAKDAKMVWEGGMPFGLFTGTRTFTLTPIANGTKFDMREDFTGPLAGLITKSIPDLQPSFDKFGDALKRKAEQ